MSRKWENAYLNTKNPKASGALEQAPNPRPQCGSLRLRDFASLHQQISWFQTWGPPLNKSWIRTWHSFKTCCYWTKGSARKNENLFSFKWAFFSTKVLSQKSKLQDICIYLKHFCFGFCSLSVWTYHEGRLPTDLEIREGNRNNAPLAFAFI